MGAGSARRTRRKPESGAPAYRPTIRRTEAAPTFFDLSVLRPDKTSLVGTDTEAKGQSDPASET